MSTDETRAIHHVYSETAVQKARKTRSAPGWVLTKQLAEATKASERDELRRELERQKAEAQELLEAKTNQHEDFEAAGPNLMRRAKQRSKERGRSMASSKDRQHRQAAAMLSTSFGGSARTRPQAIKRVKSTCSLPLHGHSMCMGLLVYRWKRSS